MHWSSAVHVDRHELLVPHWYAPQSIVLAWVHVPAPEQNDGGWNVVPVHEMGAPQIVDGSRCSHAPLTHRPVLPHGGLATQLGASGVPLGTLAQVPAPLTLHDWHAAQLPVVQQTPSTQLPVPHSLLALHAAPGTFLGTQLPGLPLQ